MALYRFCGSAENERTGTAAHGAVPVLFLFVKKANKGNALATGQEAVASGPYSIRMDFGGAGWVMMEGGCCTKARPPFRLMSPPATRPPLITDKLPSELM